MSDSLFSDWNLTSELTEQEKAIRDLFVEEYLKDFDAVMACLRIGFQKHFANRYAERFLEETYVAKKIQEAYEKEPENQVERDRALVLNTLRQAAQHGPYNTRIAAAAKLASIQGFDKTQASDRDDVADLLKEFSEKVE